MAKWIASNRWYQRPNIWPWIKLFAQIQPCCSPKRWIRRELLSVSLELERSIHCFEIYRVDFYPRIFSFRNPNGGGTGVWCYAPDSEQVYETCSIPPCGFCGLHLAGDDVNANADQYRPESSTCMDTCWTDDDCRNSKENSTQYSLNETKCLFYTPCAKWRNGMGMVPIYSDSDRNAEADASYNIDPPISTTCGELRVRQANYRGYLNVTSKGYYCRPWATQFPHNPDNYPLDGLENNNYCR